MKKNLSKKSIFVSIVFIISIISFSLVTEGSINSHRQSVDILKIEMKKAPMYFVEPALKGKIVSSSSLYPVLNNVKRNYQVLQKTIFNANVSENEKNEMREELNSLYNEKIEKALISYIDAYNYATKYLEPLLKEIKMAEEQNDFPTVVDAYHRLSVQLKSRSAILYRFTGKTPRDLLLKTYKMPADEKRNELILPVTIYMKISEVKSLLQIDEKEQARKVMSEIHSLVAQLKMEKESAFNNALLHEVQRVQNLINLETDQIEPSPTEIPREDNENRKQQELRLAKLEAKEKIENYKVEADYSEVAWQTIVNLKHDAINAINNANNKTTVANILAAAINNIDQIKTKAREAVDKVINQINLSLSQQEIEEARTTYEGLSETQKSSVSNIALLNNKEQNLVNSEAERIISTTFHNVKTGDNVLNKAKNLTSEGFEVVILSTNSAAVDPSTGIVTQPDEGSINDPIIVVFKVFKYGKHQIAEVSITLESPATPKAPSLLGTVVNSTTVEFTFIDDVIWRGKITEVFMDGKYPAIHSSRVVTAEGKITINLSGAPLSPGTHEFLIKADGYEDTIETVEVPIPEATPTLTGEMVNLVTVQFTFIENAAWRGKITGVFMDGNYLPIHPTRVVTAEGKITINLGITLSPGTHEFLIKADGYENTIGTVEVPVPEPTPILTGVAVNLETVQFTFTENAAWRGKITEIFMDGKYPAIHSSRVVTAEGKITINLSGAPLSPGTHEFLIKADGYEDTVGTIYVEN